MDDLSFPTLPGYPPEQVRRVQLRLLDMAKVALPILDRHGFKYFVAFGTLLGAVRHGGFIPWDDDFDIFLFDEEYDAAIRVLKAELPDDIFVHDRTVDFRYYPAWARLRDRGSDCSCIKFPDDNVFNHHGINLDLYRLKKVPADEIDLYRQKELVQYLVRKHDAGCFSDEEFNRKFYDATARLTQLVNISSSTNVERKVYSFVILLRKYEEAELFPLKKMKFEDIEVWCPHRPEVMLQQAYGADYMTCLPYEKRIPHYDSVRFFP